MGGINGVKRQSVFQVKQGSSENDSRLDVYDCLEFKIVSNCCYLNRCHTNCDKFVNLGNFPSIKTGTLQTTIPVFQVLPDLPYFPDLPEVPDIPDLPDLPEFPE